MLTTTTAPRAARDAATFDNVPQMLIEAATRSLVQSFGKMIGQIVVSIPEHDAREMEGVVGLISFVGDVTWSLALMFPPSTAEALALKFAGFAIEYESADMGDVVGEIANVLAGVICGELEGAGTKCIMSLPTVTRGQHVELLLGGHLTACRLAASAAGHEFAVRLIVSKASFAPHLVC